MKVEIQIQGLDQILRSLQSLPEEIASKNGGPVRSAMRVGAVLILKEARKNFKAAVALPGKTGQTNTTGFTENNIVTKRKIPRGGIKGERFIIAVNYKPHPSGSTLEKSRAYKIRSDSKKRRARSQMTTEKAVRANDIAFMMEYGTSKQEATPWLVPAFNAKAEEAINLITEDLAKRIERIAAKLAKGK